MVNQNMKEDIYVAKGKSYYNNGKLKFEGEFKYGKIWDGKGYNKEGGLSFEIKNGKGNIKEYDDDYGKLRFEGEYVNE